MPIFLLLVGLVLVISGAKGTVKDLGALIKEDFAPTSGVAGFGVWIVALIVIGLFGYVPKLKPISTAFLVLVFVGIMLSNRGFFNQFSSALKIGK